MGCFVFVIGAYIAGRFENAAFAEFVQDTMTIRYGTSCIHCVA